MNSRYILLVATLIAIPAFAADVPVPVQKQPIQAARQPVPAKLVARPTSPPLPGIAAGVKVPVKNSVVIRTAGDGTEAAYLSKLFPNRIATPFASPRMIGNAPISKEIDGSNIFIVPKSDKPFTVYITGSALNDPVVSLTLIPQDVPSQTITVQLDSTQGLAQKTSHVDSYTKNIVDLLKTAALGRTPEGYSEGSMPNIVVTHDQNQLVILPLTRLSGSTLDIYKYKVQNNQEDIELSETQFYRAGVRAVSIVPSVVLHKGESAMVYVLADKSLLEGGRDGQ